MIKSFITSEINFGSVENTDFEAHFKGKMFDTHSSALGTRVNYFTNPGIEYIDLILS